MAGRVGRGIRVNGESAVTADIPVSAAQADIQATQELAAGVVSAVIHPTAVGAVLADIQVREFQDGQERVVMT